LNDVWCEVAQRYKQLGIHGKDAPKTSLRLKNYEAEAAWQLGKGGAPLHALPLVSNSFTTANESSASFKRLL
jgi:hypothetical protein